MIFDKLIHSNRYPEIPYLKTILQFVSGQDCAQIPEGELEVLDRDLFVRVAEYQPDSPESKKFELHRDYADLQLVIRGHEVIQFASGLGLKPVSHYDPEADIQFFDTPPLASGCCNFIFL